MKLKKSLLSWALPAAVSLFALTACSDYDNGFPEAKMQYDKEFREAYGDIDPEQDWNLAVRATVNVVTEQISEVKIYALTNGKYCLVGDYPYVKGEQTLGFDVIEGTTDIIVSDGKTAQKTTVGGSVTFAGTRTVHENDGSTNGGYVKISKITDDAGVTIGDVTYPKYYYMTNAEKEAMMAVVPENQPNLNKVSHDFSYVSTGKFVVYPCFWWTSSNNTIGVYYYDSNNIRREVDLYTIKEGDELLYENITSETPTTVLNEEAEMSQWSISYSNGDSGQAFHRNTWSTESDLSNMKTPFIEAWRGTGKNLVNSTISHNTINVVPGSYAVKLDVRLFNEGSTTTPSGVTFFVNDSTINLSDYCWKGTYTIYDDKGDVSTESAELYATIYKEFEVDADGTIDLGFTCNNVVGDWLAFKNLQIIRRGEWASTADRNSFGNITRGQGIVVDIPAGVKFGMYLRANETKTYYSQSELNNDPSVCGYGVSVVDGKIVQQPGTNPCYASSFNVAALGGQMFLGFEDWPNTAQNSDFDFNDMVFAFSGATPTVVEEDPEPAASWIVACEDLGGTFDTDYNDVVFKVEHVSGQDYALVTPLAAGGTRASYLFFEDPTTTAAEVCLGEIHQLFGAEPTVSSGYTPVNVGASRGSAGTPVKISVGSDWSMAAYTSDAFSTSGQYNKYNMGGFKIMVLPRDAQPLTGTIYSSNSAFGEASIVAAPNAGDVPEMLCIPAYYVKYNDPSANMKSTYEWAWPRELQTIADGAGNGSYPKFAEWVSDHTKSGDWYMYPNGNTVSELKYTTSMATVDEGSSSDSGDDSGDDNGNTEPTTKKTGAMYNKWGQQVKPNYGYINIWGTDSNGEDKSATLYTGQGAQFEVGLVDGATGTVTYSWDNGNTGAECSFNDYTNHFEISKIASTGTIKVTLHYSGDSNYEAQDISYSFKVRSAICVKIVVNDENDVPYGITWEDNMLKLRQTNALYLWVSNWNQDPYNAKWIFEEAGDSRTYEVNGESKTDKYYYLYNVGQKKYLLLYDRKDSKNDPYYEMTESIPNGVTRGKFAFDYLLRLYAKKSTTRYLGTSVAVGDAVGIYPGQEEDNAYRWYTVGTSPTNND